MLTNAEERRSSAHRTRNTFRMPLRSALTATPMRRPQPELSVKPVGMVYDLVYDLGLPSGKLT